jgi:hypothetical protein
MLRLAPQTVSKAVVTHNMVNGSMPSSSSRTGKYMIIYGPSPKDFWKKVDIILEDGESMPKSKIDVEEEIAKILQEEIWKELILETGKTKADLDKEIIDELVKIFKEK